MRRRAADIVRAAFREPLTVRPRRELLFCVVGVAYTGVGLVLIGVLVVPGTAVTAVRAGLVLALLLVFGVATGAARAIGEAFRRLGDRLLEGQVAPPPSLELRGHALDRAGARLGDGVAWRAVAYGLLKLPLGLLELYALSYWAGVIAMTYPFWWRLFRNHPPGVELSPVPVVTPFGVFDVRAFIGTLIAFVIGASMVLAAPWVTRAVTAVDRWLIRNLLGPGRISERVRHLEEARTQVVDDAATQLRRIERDLHDGTQAQLATLAMKLGQAKEKLEPGSDVPYDPSGALGLIDDAHRQAKEALIELRNLAHGIHPPALDVGLDAALATLVARSAVPTSLDVNLPSRPGRPIETIAYFSTAELLANVAKHSRAHRASVSVSEPDGRVRLDVTDDGIGGAVLGSGSGLAGLADRIGTVDGDMRIVSPPGGPTTVTVELPIQA